MCFAFRQVLDCANFKEKQLCNVKLFPVDFWRTEPENLVSVNRECL